MKELDWQTILTGDLPLREIIWNGNGKDAELMITLTDDRSFTLPISDLTVASTAGLVVKTTPVSDLSVAVSFSGQDIVVRSMRVAFDSRYPDMNTEFREDVRQWLAGESDDLNYVVDADIDLRTASTEVRSATVLRPS
jgi:hypothetical protein